ncbi:MAG: alpha/beta hydrolase family protein, partial [Thermoanaerobaculia bacterium]
HVRFEYGAVASLYDPRPFAVGFGIGALALFATRSLLGGNRSKVAAAGWVGAGLVTILGLRLLLFTYAEHEVRFTAADGTVLLGTLFAPRGEGPFPAVIFLHGSGAEDRHEFGWHSKLLARHGFAALAYDKRGAGRSGGSTWEVGYEGYATDAIAALAWLAERAEIDGRRLGVLGHSEGGWVAPIVAESLPRLAFVVVTSATDLSPAEQVVYETRAAVTAEGFARQDVEKAAELPRRLYEPQEYAWWRSVMDFDPRLHWRNVRAPVLAISGGLDRNSDPQASQAGIAAALAAGGNDRFTGRIFPRMEHGTVEWWLPGGLPPPRFPSGYRDLLVTWMRQAVRETR